MNTQEKGLVVIREDNIFDKFIKFFKGIFSKQEAESGVEIKYLHEKTNKLVKSQPKIRRSIFKERYIIPQPLKTRKELGVQIVPIAGITHKEHPNIGNARYNTITHVNFEGARTIKLNNGVFGRFIYTEGQDKIAFLREMSQKWEMKHGIEEKEQLVRTYNVLDEKTNIENIRQEDGIIEGYNNVEIET